MAKPDTRRASADLDPLWYKSAIIYEVPVRAFFDSDADGIGDFRGLTQKLDYLQDLGVTALWLLPFYPSPLKDDGYDIADYYSINPIYGTLDDFKEFVREAKQRGLRIITELVLNHTSDQHPWFQRSRRAPAGSPERDFYVWSDTPEKYKEARIIFKDFEPSNWTWDPVARAYYWHRFYSHQPDLNFDNPAVHRELQKVFEFWLDLGVDGMRLDAVPYLYEREGTSCENLMETHDYLKKLRAQLDAKYGDRMLLAEANQWPEDAVTYFGGGTGDECHMAFHFPIMPRLFMAVRLEDRTPITDILDQTPSIPGSSQWALFLRNHDELTLEMVTDEERDYMYRVYASQAKARINLGIRRRLAPLLDNNRRRIELLNLLLLSLPGTPVIYYGDEIGMGDNIFLGDRNGVRTPMHWSADKNAGFSRTSPQALYAPIILDPEYHYEAVNVDTQQKNEHSLLWWTKRVLALRKRWNVFGFGSLEFLQPENRKVLAFVRKFEDEVVLVVANLSRFTQPVDLDLSRFNGHVPVELFGRTQFPAIDSASYPLTLGPHEAFWFCVEPVAVSGSARVHSGRCKTLQAELEWHEVVTGGGRNSIDVCLAQYLEGRSWFVRKDGVKSAHIRELVPLPGEAEANFLAIAHVDYSQSDPEEFVLPLGFASEGRAELIEDQTPASVLAHTHVAESNSDGIVFDAAGSVDVGRALFEAIASERSFKSQRSSGRLVGAGSPLIKSEQNGHVLKTAVAFTEQGNTTVVYDDKFVLKLFRRIEPGVHPGLEAARFLADKNLPQVPPYAGALEFERPGAWRACLGILSGFVAGTDGWQFTLDTLGLYFDRVRTLAGQPPDSPARMSVAEFAESVPSQEAAELIGSYFESARVLGQRTGELHVALASSLDNKDFAPEPFTPFYQRSLYQSLRNHLMHQVRMLRRDFKKLPESVQPLAENVIGSQSAILSRYAAIYKTPLEAERIRCHGNFHLGHVLHTGKDFVIIDFEGEPTRSLSERRIKRSPLRDVAAMMYSFHYAMVAALAHQRDAGAIREEQMNSLRDWARYWSRQVNCVFLNAYRTATAGSNLLPKTRQGLAVLLEAFLLDQSVTELSRLWYSDMQKMGVPLQGILRIIGQDPNV